MQNMYSYTGWHRPRTSTLFFVGARKGAHPRRHTYSNVSSHGVLASCFSAAESAAESDSQQTDPFEAKREPSRDTLSQSLTTNTLIQRGIAETARMVTRHGATTPPEKACQGLEEFDRTTGSPGRRQRATQFTCPAFSSPVDHIHQLRMCDGISTLQSFRSPKVVRDGASGAHLFKLLQMTSMHASKLSKLLDLLHEFTQMLFFLLTGAYVMLRGQNCDWRRRSCEEKLSCAISNLE